MWCDLGLSRDWNDTKKRFSRYKNEFFLYVPPQKRRKVQLFFIEVIRDNVHRETINRCPFPHPVTGRRDVSIWSRNRIPSNVGNEITGNDWVRCRAAKKDKVPSNWDVLMDKEYTFTIDEDKAVTLKHYLLSPPKEESVEILLCDQI